MTLSQKTRIALIKSNYGRMSNWLVELDQVQVARLIKPKPEEMFWYSYQIDSHAGPNPLNPEFWNDPRLSFRHEATRRIASHAFAGKLLDEAPPRILIRALSVQIKPTLWERALAKIGG